VAFKLDSKMKKRRDEIVADMERKKAGISDAISYYNQSLEDARDFINNDLVGKFNDEFDEKSEKWQEGERADATRTWIDEIEAIANDFEDIDEPDSIDEQIEKLNLIENEPSY
jgi:hypothetical protein